MRLLLERKDYVTALCAVCLVGSGSVLLMSSSDGSWLTGSAEEPLVPWCRKAAVMVGVNQMQSALLWSGKGHDKVAKGHGSSMLGDLWVLRAGGGSGGASGGLSGGGGGGDSGPDSVSWRKVAVSSAKNDAPDGRWKTSGDRIGNYFFGFGGDDGEGTFLNDLWVLPLNNQPNLSVYSGFTAPANNRRALLREGAGERPRLLDSSSIEGSSSSSIIEGSSSSSGGGDNPEVKWVRLELQTGAALPHERRGHTLTALPESRKLVLVGGRKKHEVCLSDVWVLPLPALFNAEAEAGVAELRDEVMVEAWASARWIEANTLPGSCRWGHSSVLVADPTTGEEMAAVFGGRFKDIETGAFDYNDELWLFTASSTSVTTTDDASGSAATAAAAAGDLEIGHWTLAQTGDAKPSKRDHHASAATEDRHGLYVFGGRTAESMDHVALADLWHYSIVTQTWTEVKPHGLLPRTRYLHSATMLMNQLFVFGGEHILHKIRKGHSMPDRKLNDLWSYSVATNTWTQLRSDECNADQSGWPNTPPSDEALGMMGAGLLACGGALSLVLVCAASAHAQKRGGGAYWFDYCRPRMARIRNTAPAESPYVMSVELPGRATSAAIAGAMAGGRRAGYQPIG